MQSQAATVEEYITELRGDRQKPIAELRKIIRKNLPKGFVEGMGYGMLGTWYHITFIRQVIMLILSFHYLLLARHLKRILLRSITWEFMVIRFY